MAASSSQTKLENRNALKMAAPPSQMTVENTNIDQSNGSHLSDSEVVSDSIAKMRELLDRMVSKAAVEEETAAVMKMQRFNCKETEDLCIIYVDMPGISKENVKVSVEDNNLIVKGEEVSELSGRSYGGSIELPKKKYKLDSIKAQMKNGVLTVVIPKIKVEPVVYQVDVE